MIVTDASFKRLDIAPMNRPTWRDGQDQRYVVGWAEAGVVKIGSTFKGKQRWGPFLARGGVMLDIACYEHATEAEIHLQRVLDSFYPRAFQFKDEAREILGCGGAGYLECYLVPASDWGLIQHLAREA